MNKYLHIVCAASLLLACVGCGTSNEVKSLQIGTSGLARRADMTEREVAGLTASVASLQQRVNAPDDKSHQPEQVLPEPCAEDAYVIKEAKP